MLLEHRHHVMHIRLPDKHVASHFCLQAFLSEQSFRSLSLSCSSAVILLLFISVGAASSNFTRVVCWYRLELHSGSFLRVGLVHHIDYFPLQTRYISNIIANVYIQSFNWYLVLVARAELFKYKYTFFNKQSIFDPRPENCLSFFKKSFQKIV